MNFEKLKTQVEGANSEKSGQELDRLIAETQKSADVLKQTIKQYLLDIGTKPTGSVAVKNAGDVAIIAWAARVSELALLKQLKSELD